MAREYKDSANREHSYAGINYAEEQPVLERKLKDSGIEWIGEIPVEWNVTEIKRIMRNKSVRNQPDAMVLSLYRDYGIIPKDSRDDNFNVTSDDTTNYKVVGIGDFVINKMKAWQGSMAVSEFDGIISPAYYVCSFTDKNISRKYIHYLLRNESYKPEYMRLSTGLRIGQWDLGIDDFMKIPIVVPSLDEQQRIADFLDEKCREIDKLVALQEQMIEELKAYKQSVITEAVTKGLNPDAPMKDSGIDWLGDIPNGWEIKKVKYIVDSISKGNGITKDEVFADGDTPCVRYGEIYSKYNQAFTECYSATKIELQNSPHYFNRGDILCAGTGELVEEIGKSIVYLGEKPCLAGGDIIIISHRQDPSFLNYALNCNYVQTQKSKGKAKLKVVHISAFEIGSIFMLLPSLEEQNIIADYLDNKCSEIDSLITLKQQKIDALKEYKKSLIFECVTGKKEIN